MGGLSWISCVVLPQSLCAEKLNAKMFLLVG